MNLKVFLLILASLTILSYFAGVGMAVLFESLLPYNEFSSIPEFAYAYVESSSRTGV